jgi:hypothetical protein
VDAQFPRIRGTKMDTLNFTFQEKESSLAGASRQGSMEGSGPGEPQCSGASEGSTGQDPSSVSLEGLAEKVGSLGLQRHKRNRCGAAKRRAGRARLAVASGQPAIPARNSKYGWARGAHGGGQTLNGCTWSFSCEG